MGGIINHLQSVFVSDILYCLRIAWLSIHMDWHDSRRPRSDGCLYLVRIHIARSRIDVNKHRFAAIPPDAVCSSNEAIWRSYNFSSYAQRLQCREQRQRTVSEEAYERHFQISGQFFLQLLMIVTVVSNPLTLPNLLQFSCKIVETWKERRRYGYQFIIHKKKETI